MAVKMERENVNETVLVKAACCIVPILWVPGRAVMSSRGALIQDADNVTISISAF